MRKRTMTGIAVPTLALIVIVVAGALQIDRRTRTAMSAPDVSARATASPSAVQSLPGRLAVPEPDHPVVTEMPAPTEPLTRPVLEPRQAPAPDPVPPVAAGPMTFLVFVPPAPGPVAEPDAPVLVDDAGLEELLVLPDLSPVQLRAPSPAPVALAARDCRGAPTTGEAL